MLNTVNVCRGASPATLDHSGHHTKTAVSSAEQRRWRLPPFNQSVNFDLESNSVVWSTEEEQQLVKTKTSEERFNKKQKQQNKNKSLLQLR